MQMRSKERSGKIGQMSSDKIFIVEDHGILRRFSKEKHALEDFRKSFKAWY